ncbi:MAG: hypothetical protein ACKVPX_09455 [Myxococcaceae bacterium]
MTSAGLLALFAQTAVWAASPSAMLAPSQPELVERLTQLRAKLERADAISAALFRVSNRIGERLADGAGNACSTPELQSLAARAEIFGSAYRDIAQGVRADAERLARLLEAPSLAPLLQEDDRNQALALDERAQRHTRRYLEAWGWNRRFVHAARRRCTLAVGLADGLSPAGPTPTDEADAPVAVIVQAGGQACPQKVEGHGQVVVLPSPQACYTTGASCDCQPRPILPGAVLGP